MASPEDQGRTEPATPKRRSKARQKGQVAKSREINTAVVILAGVSVLSLWGAGMYQHLTGLMRFSFIQSGQGHLDPVMIHKLFLSLGKTGFTIMAPLLFTLMVAAVLANYAQVGRMFSLEIIKPKLPQLNLLKGFQRMFSGRSLVELGKALIKVAIIGLIAWLTLKREFQELLPLMDQEVGQIVIFMLQSAATLFWRVGAALLALSVLDFLYQRYQTEKNLKMTKEEVKDERRQAEGDPQVKSKLRGIMLKRAMRRMMAQVPKADVVITNPTHIAVALRYDSAAMAAPQVVAKGKGFVALKIMELADAAQVPRVENKPLAHALYKSVEVDDYIPVNLYRAVAEILAHIYRTRGRTVNV